MKDEWGVNFGRKVSEKSVGDRTETVNTAPSYLEIVTAKADTRERTGEYIIELYGFLRPSLTAYLSSQGLSKEQSEDVIQEAFLRLVRHSSKRQTTENLRAWLFRVAHNLSMDHHRSQKRRLQGSELEAQL